MLLVLLILLPLALVPFVPTAPVPQGGPAPTVELADRAARDQDDLCIWVHPDDPAKSTVIASDKHADKLFVYDLAGKTLQTLLAKHPGNIDIRSGFPLGNAKVDIVAVNLRDQKRLAVYRVQADTRQLSRIDDGAIDTGDNYGGCLYRSARTGKFYAFITSYSGRVAQIELADDGAGKVRGKTVRAWKLGGVCEGAVADDRAGKLYIAHETKGVWEVGAEPDAATPGELAIKLGEHGLKGEVEGLAIVPSGTESGYLIVSDQGKNAFRVYRREGKHNYIGSFAVKGAIDTDGIDVLVADLGPSFPGGLFACHSAAKSPCPILLTPWEAIARSFNPPLFVPPRATAKK